MRPIETAPKTGERVLLDGGVVEVKVPGDDAILFTATAVAWWDRNRGWAMSAEGGGISYKDAKRWMPLQAGE